MVLIYFFPVLFPMWIFSLNPEVIKYIYFGGKKKNRPRIACSLPNSALLTPKLFWPFKKREKAVLLPRATYPAHSLPTSHVQFLYLLSWLLCYPVTCNLSKCVPICAEMFLSMVSWSPSPWAFSPSSSVNERRQDSVDDPDWRTGSAFPVGVNWC